MKLLRYIARLLVYPILFLGIFYSIFKINETYFLDEYESERLSIDVEFKVEENDVFQLFYRDSISKLSEKSSENIKIIGSDRFQWITFSIPDSLDITQIRFDFGNRYKVTPVEIKQFLLRYNGNTIDLAKDSLTSYFRLNQYTTQLSKTIFSRKKIGERSDPFLLSNSITSKIKQLRQEKNYSKGFLNLIISLLLSISLITALKQLSITSNIVVVKHQIFIAVFLLLLFVSFTDQIFSLDKTEIQEKRELVAKPKLAFENIKKYPIDFENYFNDHFGFRNKLISFGGILKAKLFKTSPRIEKVIVGNNNWLFFWEQTIKKSYLNINPFPSDKLGRLENKLKNINSYAEGNGISFLATIYPNKHTIYEKEIPNRYKALKQEGESRINQFYKFANKNEINNIDNREILSLKSKDRELYFKNDSHWNSNGAYEAYKNIFEVISKKDTGIVKPLLISEFNLAVTNDYLKGDLVNLLGVDNSFGYFKDNYYSYKTKKPLGVVRREDLYGNKSLLYENANSGNEKVALIFGDSFSHAILQFIPFHFKKTIFIRNINIDIAIIKKIKPDYVIYGIVERNLELF